MSSTKIVATCKGLRVPASPFLNETRIQRLNSARYEGQEIAGALEVVRPGDKVLELGAGIGIVGAVTAINAKPQAVLSFEANPNLIPHIRELHEANGLADRMEVRNQVIMTAPDHPDTVTFYLHNSYLGSSLVDSDRRETRPVEVDAVSYDAVCEEFDPDVLVMDIEGGELDFLRHADLSRIRAVVIEFHPGVYGTRGMKECKNILRRAGFGQVPDHCSRTVWTCHRKNALPADPPRAEGGWATEIKELKNAVVVPPEDAGFAFPAGVLDADGNHVECGASWRHDRPITTRPAPPKMSATRLEGRWLWSGVLYKNFAHFMAESTGRLWALDVLDTTKIDGLLFIPRRPRVGDQLQRFQTAFIAAIGCDLPIKAVTEPTEVEELVVPGQGFGLGSIIEGTDAYRAMVSNRFGRDIAAEGPPKLYVSRSRIGRSRGTVLGEIELENRLAAEGYEVFHPQEHDLATQIARYKAAKHILATEGSALHVVAFTATADQKVGIIMRRHSSATEMIARHLASFSGTEPMIFNALSRTWMREGAKRRRLGLGELDMPQLQAQLRESGFLPRKGKAWTQLSEDALAAELGDGYQATWRRDAS